uniref:ribosomal protein L20 n=1 Tax=Polulichloris maxima TaxID=2704661 RepID=UPI0024112C94|nr:ribosomal protein L20 [Polulichloris maxima]WDY13266.1 ribosomal protein L20 [Polulichloris maxima]
MTRIKRGNVARKRRKKILNLSSGFRGSSSKLFRVANQRIFKALQNSSHDRKNRKRNYRSRWITRINAATRASGLSYSQFIYRSKESQVLLNRKIVSQLAVLDKDTFQQLVHFVNAPKAHKPLQN